MTSDREGRDQSDRTLELAAGEGRRYKLGKLAAVFKADEDETGSRYSISEWWLEPGCEGVGPHSHEANEEIYYVIKGRPSILIGTEWRDYEEGAFVRIPANVMHDFCNRSDREAGLLNLFIPGGFERSMPSIVAWFEQNGS